MHASFDTYAARSRFTPSHPPTCNTADMFQERGIEARLTESIDKAQEKFDIVVDCTGNQQGFDTALNLVRPRSLCLCVCARVCVCVCLERRRVYVCVCVCVCVYVYFERRLTRTLNTRTQTAYPKHATAYPKHVTASYIAVGDKHARSPAAVHPTHRDALA